MRKILLMIVLGLGLNMNAQTDSYFIFNYEYRETDNEEWSQILLLPDAHGLHYNIVSGATITPTSRWRQEQSA